MDGENMALEGRKLPKDTMKIKDSLALTQFLITPRPGPFLIHWTDFTNKISFLEPYLHPQWIGVLPLPLISLRTKEVSILPINTVQYVVSLEIRFVMILSFKGSYVVLILSQASFQVVNK